MYPKHPTDVVANDTGKKWVAGDGTVYRVLRKKISIGALPNATTKNVAHGETIDPAKKVTVVEFWASKGDASAALTTMTSLASITIDATNVKVTTGADQSLYTSAEVVIEWAQA